MPQDAAFAVQWVRAPNGDLVPISSLGWGTIEDPMLAGADATAAAAAAAASYSQYGGGEVFEPAAQDGGAQQVRSKRGHMRRGQGHRGAKSHAASVDQRCSSAGTSGGSSICGMPGQAPRR
ncbi:hypothetical protein JKP88DRAFT_274266 [Tribonema minus]|uniref:Uncharacterized protein n=1 Tax=Tribonema minus TaxID=303371 RepID=A0A835YKR8_9STRA|nr:hypothetical protein JKP88DRAFT_274266 [Tribonema minus]